MLLSDWQAKITELGEARAALFEIASIRSADPEDKTEVRDAFIEAEDGTRSEDPFVGFTEDEITEFRSNETEVVKANAWIKRLTSLDELATNARNHKDPKVGFAGKVDSVNIRTKKIDLWDFENVRSLDEDALYQHTTNVVGEMRKVKDDFRTHMETVMEDYDERAVNLHICATSSQDFRSAFWKLVTGNNHMLTPNESQSLHWAEEQRAALALGSGYLLPINIDPTTRFTTVTTRNPIRELASNRIISTNVHNSNTMGNASFAMANEGTESVDGTPGVGTVAITAQQAHGSLIYSMSAEEDVNSLERDLSTAANRGINNLEATQMLSGTGSAPQVEGVLDGTTVTRVTTDVTAVVDHGDLVKVLNALPDDYYHEGSAWVSNQQTLNSFRLLESTGGATLFHDITGSPMEKMRPSGLMGMNTRVHSGMSGPTGASTFVTTNDVMVVGDWDAGYRVVDRIGATVAPFPVLGATNRLPTGQKGMYIRWRFGAGILDANALRVLQVL